MKHDWKITLILKCGKEITGIFTSDHESSEDVYNHIFSDMTERSNEEKWMTILTAKTECASVRFREVAAIRLGV